MADTNVQIKLSADGSQVRNEIKLIDQQLQQLGNNVGVSQLNLGDGGTPISQQQQGLQQQQGNNPLQRQRDRTFTLMYREILLSRREFQTLNRNIPSLLTALQRLEFGLSQSNLGQSSITPPQGQPPLSTQSSQTLPITITSPSVIVNNTESTTQSNQQSKSSQSSKVDKNQKDNSPNIIGNMKRMLATMGIIAFLKHTADMDYQRQKSAHQTYGSLLTDSDYSGAARRATDWGKNLGYDYNEVLPAIRANQSAAGFAGLGAQQRDITSILGAARAYNIDAAILSGSAGRMTATGTFRIGEQQKFANMLAKSIKENDMRGRESEQLSVLESINANLSSRNTTVTTETMASGMNLYNAIAKLNPNMRGERGGNLANRMIDIANSRDTGLDILAGLGTTYTGITGELELMKLSENDPQQYYKKVWENLVASYGDNPDDEFSATNQLMYKLTKGQGMSFNQAQLAVEAIKSGGTFDTKAFSAEGQSEGQDEITKRLESYKSSTLATLDQFEIKWNELMASIGEKVNSVKATFIEWFGDIDEWVQKAENMFGTIKSTIDEYLPSFEDIKGVIDEYLPSFDTIKNTLEEVGTSITEAAGKVDEFVDEIIKKIDEFSENGGVIGSIKKSLGFGDDNKRSGGGTFGDGRKGSGGGGTFGDVRETERMKGILSDLANKANKDAETFYSNRPIDKFTDWLLFGKSEAAELHNENNETSGNFFEVSLRNRRNRNLYDENPSLSSSTKLTTTEYRDNQSISQKLTKDTNRGLAENTEALHENTKRLGKGGEGGFDKTNEERALLIQKENLQRQELESWKNLFSAQHDKDKAITDALKLIVGSLSSRSGSTTPTGSSPSSTIPKGESSPPVIPTDLKKLGTVEYNGKTYNLDALRDDIEKNDYSTKHLPTGKLALFSTLLFKKLSGGKAEIAPGAIYGQNEIESGGGLHSSDPDTLWWYQNNRNIGGQHAPKGTDPSKLAHERNGKLNVGSTTGMPFWRYGSFTESFADRWNRYLKSYGLGKILTGSQYAQSIPNYLTGSSNPNDPRVIEYGRKIDEFQRDFDKYFNGADSAEFDKYTIKNNPVSVDTNQVTINADKVTVPKNKPDKVEEVNRQIQGGADPRGLGAITVEDIKNRKSHGHGLKNVPYDLYPAQLHRGERVLTKLESEELRDIKGLPIPNEFEIDEEVDSIPEIKRKRLLQEKYKDATSYTGSNLNDVFGSDYLQGVQDDLLNRIKKFNQNQYFNAPQFAVGGEVTGATPRNGIAGMDFDLSDDPNSDHYWKKVVPNAVNYSMAVNFWNNLRKANKRAIEQGNATQTISNKDTNTVTRENLSVDKDGNIKTTSVQPQQPIKLIDSRGEDEHKNDLGSPRQWDYKSSKKPPNPTGKYIGKGSLQPTELDPFKNPRGRRNSQQPIENSITPKQQPVQGKTPQNKPVQIPKSQFSKDFMERINTELTEENYKTHFKNTESLDAAKKQQEHLKNIYEKHKDDYNTQPQLQQPIQQPQSNGEGETLEGKPQLDPSENIQGNNDESKKLLEGKINERILNPSGTVNIPGKTKKKKSGGFLGDVLQSVMRPEFISKLPFIKKLPFPAEKLMAITQMPIIKDIFDSITGKSKKKGKDGENAGNEEHHGILNRWLGRVKPKKDNETEQDEKIPRDENEKLKSNNETPEGESSEENNKIPRNDEESQDKSIKKKKKSSEFNLESIGKTMGNIGKGAQLLGKLTKNDKIGKIGGILSVAGAGIGLLGGLFGKKSKKNEKIPKEGEDKEIQKDGNETPEDEIPGKDKENLKDPKNAEHTEFNGKVTTPDKDKKKKGGGILGSLFGDGDFSKGMSTVGGILGTIGKVTGNDKLSDIGTHLGKLGAAGQMLGGLFGGEKNEPNTKGVDNRPTFKDILGGVFGGENSDKNPMEKPDILGGLFGKQSEGANILNQNTQSTNDTREVTEGGGIPSGGGNSSGIPSKIEIVVNVKGTEHWSPNTQSSFVKTLSKTFEHMLPNTNR